MDDNLRKKQLKFFIFCYWHDVYFEKIMGGPIKLWDLSENLQKFGHRVTLFLPKIGVDKDKVNFKIKEIQLINIGIIRPILFNLFSFLISLLYSLKNRPDVIYVRDMNLLSPLFLSKIIRVPLIIEVCNDPYRSRCFSSYQALKLFFVKLINWTNLVFCDKINIITERIRNKVNRGFKIPLQKMVVIASGSNINLFRPMDKGECQRCLKLDNTKKYIGFIGTLLRLQGIDILINSAPYIIENYPEVKFFIVGEGAMKREWMQKVIEKNLNEYFIFTGQVPYEEAPKYINSMDICTAPFLQETGEASPLKIFDYFACGKPVVVSDLESIRTLFEESQACIYVPPENPEELADAIIKLLKDEETTKVLGVKGRKFVVEKYSRTMVAEKVLEMSYDLIRKSRW